MVKRILIVSSEFPPLPGGIGNHGYQLAMALSERGYDVEVLTDQRSMDLKYEFSFDGSLPFKVHRTPLRKQRVWMYVSRIRTLNELWSKNDLLIATGKFSLWNVGFRKKSNAQTTIAIVHGTEVNFKSAIIKKSIERALRRFDKVIAVSNYTKRLIDNLSLPVKVIPNGIRGGEWNDGSVLAINKESLKDLIKNPVLTTVGRLSPRKGQLEVIRFLPRLITFYPKLHYHCIGLDDDRVAIDAEIERLSLSKYVTIHGLLKREKMKTILRQTDVFLMLSKEDKYGDVEGFGIAILEANALGVPAIGYENCGIEDAINNGKSGFVIPIGDFNALKLSIEKILENKTSYRDESLHWAKEHNWNRIINLYINLIDG